jgi:hypothetical protein
MTLRLPDRAKLFTVARTTWNWNPALNPPFSTLARTLLMTTLAVAGKSRLTPGRNFIYQLVRPAGQQPIFTTQWFIPDGTRMNQLATINNKNEEYIK